MPLTELMLTMAPPPCACHLPRNGLADQERPFRLTSITASQSASVMSRKSAALKMPALLTSASMRPERLLRGAPAPHRPRPCATRRSAVASALAPAPSARRRAPAPRASSTSHSATAAPSRARRLRAGRADALCGAGDHRRAVVQCEGSLTPCARSQDLRSSQTRQALRVELDVHRQQLQARFDVSVQPCSARRWRYIDANASRSRAWRSGRHRAVGCRSRPSRRSASSSIGAEVRGVGDAAVVRERTARCGSRASSRATDAFNGSGSNCTGVGGRQ